MNEQIDTSDFDAWFFELEALAEKYEATIFFKDSWKELFDNGMPMTEAIRKVLIEESCRTMLRNRFGGM